jgi:hypothetical protein
MIILFIPTSVIAQDSNKEVYPEQVSIEHNEAVKKFSKDYVLTRPGFLSVGETSPSALGLSNLAEINVLGSENIITLKQLGTGLVGYMDIKGDLNEASIFQKGTNLESILQIQGNANQFDLLQEGVDLANNFEIIGSGMSFDAVQTNTGFELNQTGVGAIPLSIEQIGGVVPIRIESN